ncbi:hypothetical protein CFRS1_v015092 [Colletotrichum fructicola]|nr:hypothetical protein CFRS1_v015092 [Colletotrichum fructicola]
MQVSSTSTVGRTQSSLAISYSPSPAPSQNFLTPGSEFNELADLHTGWTADESLTEFIDNAMDIVRALSQHHPEGQNEDFRILARDLKTNSIDTDWSKGESWLRVIEKGNDSRRRLNVSHMITSAGFASWYNFQVAEAQKMKPGLIDRMASNEVMERLMEFKTSLTTSKEVKSTVRSSLRTRVTKGRRLLGLIRTFGCGIILVKETWELLKARAEKVQAFADDLAQNTNKLIVLRHLGDQFDEFVNHGRANVASFVENIRTEAHLARLIHWDTVTDIRQLRKAFSFLNYGQIEDVCIETANVWSSGPLIVRIANLRMLGLPIGHSELDDNSLRLGVIRNFKTCFDVGTLKTSKPDYGNETTREEPRRSKRRRF